MAKIPFTVSARAAQLIGRENVANAEGALIELVKNSYDADADVSIILIDKESDSIFIIDDGEGMTKKVIKKKWMVIGTDNKKDDYETAGGRIKTGAKGIGRFALDRLGGMCEMTTKTLDKNGVKWVVNWSDFEQKGKIIEQVKADVLKLDSLDMKTEIQSIIAPFEEKIVDDIIKARLREKENENKDASDFDKSGILDEFYSHWNNNQGTILKIQGLRKEDDWSDDYISSLYSNLENLIPPKEEKIFDIFLLSSNEPERYGKIEAKINEDFDYKLHAVVKENKSVVLTIQRNELDIEGLNDLSFFQSDLVTNTETKKQFSFETFKNSNFQIKNKTIYNYLAGTSEDENLKADVDKIGPFEFTLYFMKRGSGPAEKGTSKFPYRNFIARDRRNWLDKFGGIKIFRDNFRVRPYGEIESSSFDWLGLGPRALGSPTVTKKGYKVRPNQIAGVIDISRIGNINFQDKSSREGLQENRVFQLFKQLIEAIIVEFETDRNKVMIALKEIYDKNDKKGKAKSDADDIKKDKTKDENKGFSNDEGNKLLEVIDIYKEEIEDLKDEQKLLRVLASTGLIITSFTHEFAHLKRKIGSRIINLRNVLNGLIDDNQLKSLEDFENPFVMLDDIQNQDERLRHWLDFSIAAVKKEKRTRRKINLVAYLERFERMWSNLLSDRNIKLKIDKGQMLEYYFRGHEIDLDSIFNNLIANSIDAFKRKDASDIREIEMSFDLRQGVTVVYRDSGPGLSKDILTPHTIFEPFFTTKRNRKGEVIGTGLGMWIVKSIMDEYDGTFEFLQIRGGYEIKLILPLKK